MDLSTFYAILQLVVQSYLFMLLSPLFLIIVAIVYFQYWRINKQKEHVFGIKEKVSWKHAFIAAGHGAVGGFVGTLLIVFAGVSLSGIGIHFLWLLAISLMFISPRFICFAYAGGIISLSYLIFGYPNVDVPQLIALVAILHMVESVLILFSGHLGALPLYTKLSNGQIVGGFNLQKFWPLPLVALALMVMSDPSQVAGVGMPDWWPLVKPNIDAPPEYLVYTLFPVVAALGYGDLAITSRPREKSKKTALLLGTYSFILLGLAIIASRFPMLAVVAALFSPLGHELVIKLGRDMEFKGEPRYVKPAQGVMVLETTDGTPAKRLGLKTGDIILNINGYPVNYRQELDSIMAYGGTALEVEYVDELTNKFHRASVRKGYHEPLGVILVPQGDEEYYVEISNKGILSRWWDKLRKKKE